MTPRTPSSTYRLQVRAAFDLDAAAAITDYLRDLGVGWAYLSPILQAASGSDHGYDVVDPTRVDAARGGPDGLARFSAAARAAGLGVLVDIVPNHQGVAVPAENPWWWDVLTHGEASAFAASFDIDWTHGGGTVVLPVLGADLDDVLAAGEIVVAPPRAQDAEEMAVSEDAFDAKAPRNATSPHNPTASGADAPFGTARYYDLVLPLAPGTAPLHETKDAAAVRDVLARQHWTLVSWRRDAELLNYRRFFTVTSLAGVRVELPDVFDASHVEIVRWLREGLVDGLRVDHPDGLADPGGYLGRLASTLRQAQGPGPHQSVPEPASVPELVEGSRPTPVVYVEKILEPGEELPGWWQTAGTTGYDALGEIERVLVDPAGEAALTALDTELRGAQADWADMILGTKREIAQTSQAAEVGRILRSIPAGLDADDEATRDALVELLAAFDVYRAYLPAGAERLSAAVTAASTRRPDLESAIGRLAELVHDGGSELSRRFMQTTGPVMAKGVEDRAFYRYSRLTSLTEVGGDPSRFAHDPAQLHAAFARRQASWPAALTALTTHDTKRSEDVRARLDVLAEVPERWAAVLVELRQIASTGDGPLDGLLWQAVVGAWSGDPALPGRLHAYVEKAAREGAVVTTWQDPDADAEAAVHALVDAACGPARPVIEAFVAEIVDAGRSNALSAKLLQLAGPGVPDVYQGTELWDLSLVDPDNRRAVDFEARRALLARLDEGWRPPVDDTGAAKLLLVSRTLRLRRDRPDLFTRYTPLETVGAAAGHAIAFDRGGAIAVATRLPVGLAARGGWGDAVVMLPAGTWRDELTGRAIAGGAASLAELLADYPVALLVPGRMDA